MSTEAAFNDYALSYDSDFTNSRIGKFQRARVWRYLEKNVSAETYPQVLELNCGTGEDALWLSQKGFDVAAIDISPEMVAVANKKLSAAGVKVFQGNIQTVHEKVSDKKFDLVFSNFGGMNCLSPEELKNLAKNISRLLNDKGRLIFVIMGRNCKWEQFYFKRKKDLKSAYRRRSKEPVEADIFGEKFSTWYYSPEEIKSFFSREFHFLQTKPIGIALPPSYLNNYFQKHPVRLNFLNGMEKIIGTFSALSDKADHYLIDFVKSE